MSISQDSAATIVCREVFDATSHPSDEEVLEYARRLGIDPDAEPHLMDLAREGLMAALPKGWRPCYHEATGAWYYYQTSTGTTTWEHPLDAVYKELVEQARAGNARQMSVEEDSKTTAKDLESHEEATLPKEASSSKDITKSSSNTNLPPTRIPTKLTPLKKPEKLEGVRRKESPSQEKQFKPQNDQKLDTPLATDRASRDYTNLKFQDPKFYECPKLLENAASTSATGITASTPPKKELDLKEVLKRSESLSPRNEKWEQLSCKFSSEESIIDIDKLSASTLFKSEKTEKFDKEKHPSQFGQQKELTLSGGGTMFLKSNRSRDNTPSQEAAKLDDFRSVAITDDTTTVGGDRLKSILREKQTEDEDRPVDEERKSVRFDIEREVDIKFTYSASEDDWESESEEQNVRISAVVTNKVTGSILSSQRSITQSFDDENKEDSESKLDEDTKRSSSSEKTDPSKKNVKIVGKRFVVQNVSETEHRSQMAKESVSRESISRESSLDYVPNKFDKVKNIDLVSKSETDCSVAKSSDSDELRKNKIETEKPNKSAIRFSDERQGDDEVTFDLSRVIQGLDLQRQDSEDSRTVSFGDAVPRRNRGGRGETAIEDRGTRRKSADRPPKRFHRRLYRQTEIDLLKWEYCEKLEKTEKDLEKNFIAEKKLLEKNLSDRLEALRRDMAEKEEREIKNLIAEMDESRLENLKKVKAELEVCYEKERQEILSNLKTELDERKRELLELRNQEMGKLEDEHERDLGEEKLAKLSEMDLTKQHTERIETLKKELEKEFDELCADLRLQQREKIRKMTEEHEKCLADILRDFRIDETVATQQIYKQRLGEIRPDLSRDAEIKTRKLVDQRSFQQDTVDIEKMRSENRLMQDKYTALREKYNKLKNDVRLAVERRRRKVEYTTASETERSTSTRTRTDRTESSEQNTPVRKTRSSSATRNGKPQEAQPAVEQSGDHQQEPDVSGAQKPAATGFQKMATAAGASKSAARIESDDTITASETNANTTKNKKKSFTKRTSSLSRASSNAANNNNNNPENPVENIRKQLEKLEDLGDQLPSNETAYTLRYPFQDKAPVNASSELEFFRHRIHVERDSVRRAQEALRDQEDAFQGRQKAWKQSSARATLEQLVQKERELSDMEVNLHRTKSLLGEKVIHLRHLEQTLERVANARRNENDASSTRNDELTLSDMSSASSGFSSTDLGTDTFIDKPDHYQESTEIIASLENLNSEIREIWSVLNKRQDSNVPPPPTLMYSYLRWLRFHHLAAQPNNVQGTFGTPNIQSNILSQLTAAQPPTTTQNIIAQYGPNSGFTTSVGTVEKTTSNLMERTWNLRDWLRQARVENTDLINPGQATL
ncbi:centrosomal protein 164 isoform X2 [Nomia melanderi]|uniref:centrosomal protein 164 isoform X2 n=1 Tax=Nomia melanderi TaxID=2448451 RepID=UPI0013047B0C|nr:centrosomal protein of 164 kDa isoform X2 [Nomia melanderi]